MISEDIRSIVFGVLGNATFAIMVWLMRRVAAKMAKAERPSRTRVYAWILIAFTILQPMLTMLAIYYLADWVLTDGPVTRFGVAMVA